MLNITKIKLGNLLDFVQSEQYLSFNEKPISLLRAESYIKNPNANLEDFVLYMAFINNELIGYRTILTDVFYNGNIKQKFGWLSGNWVHPKHRRKNISTILFKAVLKDWNNQLIYSNYAEESKALYDKTNTFSELKTLKGVRYYRRYSLAELLPPKNKIFLFIKPFLHLSDWFLNLFSDLKLAKNEVISDYKIHKIKSWNSEIQVFLSNFKEKELFRRDLKTLQWIINYPWIKTDKDTKTLSEKYQFSSYADVFENNFYVIKNNSNKIITIINISVRNKQLKIPYFYSTKEGIKPSIDLILNTCNKYKINYLTIYDEVLNNVLKNQVFLKQKPFIQKYFITKELKKRLPNLNTHIQTGDGDSVFT